MDRIEDFGVLVQNPADPLVLLAILAYRLGQVVVASGQRQNGFSHSTHPCPPWGSFL